MSEAKFRANNIVVEDGDDIRAIQKAFYESGLTDGLPIIPPTRELVDEMIAYTKRDSQEVIAHAVAPRNGVATVENIAINAVMAGCAPEYMPVLIAAVEAMTAPGFDLFGAQATTHPTALATIISGPICDELGINYGSGAYGPGFRANATIGRAVRLIMLTLGGAKPGPVDKSTQGSPAKYCYCFGENEAANPWEPLRVEYGFKKEESTVSVLALEGPQDLEGQDSQTGESLLKIFANSINTMGSCNFRFTTGCDMFLGIGPEHAHILARDGLTKNDIRQYLYEHAVVPVENIPAEHIAHRLKTPGQYGKWDGKSPIHVLTAPENLVIAVVGGPGLHSSWAPNWGGPKMRLSTKAIKMP